MFSAKTLLVFLVVAATAQSANHDHPISRGAHNKPRRLRRAPQDIPVVDDILAALLSASSTVSSTSTTDSSTSSRASSTTTTSSTLASSTTSAATPTPTCNSDGNLIDFLGHVVQDLLGQCTPSSSSVPSSTSAPTSSASSSPIPSSTTSAPAPPDPSPTCDKSGNLIDFLGNVIKDVTGQCTPPPSSTVPPSSTSGTDSTTPSSTSSTATPTPTCDASGTLVDFLGNVVKDILGQCTPPGNAGIPSNNQGAGSESLSLSSSTVPSSTSSSAAASPTCDASGNLLDFLGNIITDVLGQCTPSSSTAASSTSGSSTTVPSSTGSAAPPNPTCDASGNLIDLLGNIVPDLLGQCTPSSSTVASSTSRPSSTTSSASPTPTCDASGNLIDFLGNVIQDLTGQCTPSTPSSTSSSASPTPTCDASGNLVDFLGNVVQDLLGQCTPSTPSSSSNPPPPASSTSSAPGATPTCDSSGNLIDFLGNVIKDVLGQCTSTPSSSSNPPPPASSTSSAPVSTPTCDASGNLVDFLGNVLKDVLGQCNPVSSAGPTSIPVSSDLGSGPTSTITAAPSSFSQIVFPTLSSTFGVDNSSSTFSDPGASSVPVDAASSTSAAPISIDSIWLNVPSSALLQASVPSSTPLPTLTNPDQAATTLSLIPTQSPIPDAPLPSGIPAQILPPANLAADPNADHTGYSLVSILFDSSLPWTLETSNAQAPGQMFAYFPMTIANALDIPASNVQTLYLQAYKPTSYTGPADIALLGTMYLAYLPNGSVPILAAQIKAHNSPFYTASTGLSKDLATHVDATFAINSVSDPNSGTSDSSAVAAASNNATLVRQNAIIGVVSALGGLALIILAYLVYKSHLRKQELAHRRLTDPAIAGMRPDRDFDVDSIGAPRRRSFYFAEDSLGGAAATAAGATSIRSEESYTYHSGQDQMRERRPIVPGTISAPQLQQSSMNW